MNAKELLALLTAKVQSYVISSGGIPEVSQQDVSHAMGYIKDRNAALLIGVKLCGRSDDIWELDIALWETILFQFPEWRKEGKYTPGKEFIRHMCQTALNEHMDNHLCPTCKGTSARLKEDLKHAFHSDFLFCSTCMDSGRVHPSEETRADIIGVDRKIWRKVWSSKYRRIQAVLNAWETIAIKELQEALRQYD